MNLPNLKSGSPHTLTRIALARIGVLQFLVLVTLATGLCPAVLEAQILYQPIPSVPVSRLPQSLSRRTQTSPVNAALLRNRPTRKYFLDTDDVLGVFIEGVLGDLNESPPVQFPEPGSDLPPSIGYPVAVRDDGSISLPLVDPIYVRGLTIIQVEELIKARYLDRDQPVLKTDNRIIVSLMRKRTYSVYVLRGDNSQSSGISRSRRGAVNQRSDQSQRSTRLQLPAGDNDLLNALSQTGGLPGVNARSDVKIYRANRGGSANYDSSAYGSSAYGSSAYGSGRYQPSVQSAAGNSGFPRTSGNGSSYPSESANWNRFSSRYGHRESGYSGNGSSVTTVETRQRNGRPVAIRSSDVRLDDGDVVVIESRDTEVYYTGGLLGGGEFPIPRDRGVDVLEAIALAGQSVGAAGRDGFGIVPQRMPTELLVLRQRPGQGQITIRVDVQRAFADPSQRIQVQSGDVLILRHSRREQLQNTGIGVLNAYGTRQIFGR